MTCRWSTREPYTILKGAHLPRRVILGQSIVFGVGRVLENWEVLVPRELLAWDTEVIVRSVGIRFLVISIISSPMIDGTRYMGRWELLLDFGATTL